MIIMNIPKIEQMLKNVWELLPVLEPFLKANPTAAFEQAIMQQNECCDLLVEIAEEMKIVL